MRVLTSIKAFLQIQISRKHLDTHSQLTNPYHSAIQISYNFHQTSGASDRSSAELSLSSSEIGYAGSPPREVLTRGRSIDSVDRPFHPSDWVDVNLEVPSTPRPSSVLTNLTVDTSLYPATTPTSSCKLAIYR